MEPDINHTESLTAWIDDKYVGVLSLDASGLFSFSYNDEWIASGKGYPISPSIPFKEDRTTAIHSAVVKNFFENLLLEGKSLDDIALSLSMSKSNVFGLMRALGRETSGAITLLPNGEEPSATEQLTPIS